MFKKKKDDSTIGHRCRVYTTQIKKKWKTCQCKYDEGEADRKRKRGRKRIFELFIISQAVDNQMEALLGKNKLRGKNNKEHCVDDGRRRKLRI